MTKYILFLIILISPLNLRADIKLFLYSKKEVSVKNKSEKSRSLSLGDISRVEGRSDYKNKIENINIPSRVMRDGFVDRSEVYSMIKTALPGQMSGELIFVYGSSVRIIPLSSTSEASSTATKAKKMYILKGDTVDVSIRRNGVVVEMIGTSKMNARVGDRVNVELPNKKMVKGILKKGSENSPEVEVLL